MEVSPPVQPAEKIRVLCVVYNPGDELRTFVGSLQKATKLPYELILIDNAEKAAIIDEIVASDTSGAISYVPSGGNLGYGRGNNVGARQPGHFDWLVVANPDIEWTPGSLDRLIATARRNPTAGTLGPRICSVDGNVYPSARPIPSIVRGSGHALLGKIWPGNPFTRGYKVDVARVEKITAVGWVSGACLLIRPEVWEAVGGFDDRYFMFFEDTDLGDRVAKAGWANLYVPKAVVIHEQGSSYKATPTPMIRAHHASAKLFFNDHHAAGWQAPLRALIGAGLSWREKREVSRAERQTHRP